MADKVAIELVSPERLILSDAVDMIVVPGAAGDFGVLAGHSPLISSLRPGVIEIHDGGDVRERIFVAGGFAEVTTERCTLLAEDAAALGDLDRGEIDSRIGSLENELRDATDPAERAEGEAQLAVAQAKVVALDYYRAK